MKKIESISLSKSFIKSSLSKITFEVFGDIGASFNLQIIEKSAPVKFYNFKSNTFTSVFSSENNFTATISRKSFKSNIIIPANASGATYDFLVFGLEHLDTQSGVKRATLTQGSDVTVRFSTSTDQTASFFQGIGTFVGSVSGSSSSTTSSEINVSNYSISDSDGSEPFRGYKFEVDNNAITHKVADNLQPVDTDFFTKLTKTTSGGGSSVTTMVLTDVDNLVVGMSLISITSSTVTTSGSLGVLTYPTITAIDTENKTITLSSAHSWADNKSVVFRAYGLNLISESVGGSFEFNNFEVRPGTSSGPSFRESFGTAVVNGTFSNTAFVVDGQTGISSGGRIFGPGVDTSGNNNVISTVNGGATDIEVAGTQSLKDNVVLRIAGCAQFAYINGTITIKTFPSISTDIFYDVDRAIVLSTTS